MKIKLKDISNQLKAVCFSLVVLMMLGYQGVNAQRFPVQDGPWEDISTWDGGTSIPSSGQSVTISGGWFVSVNVDNSANPISSLTVQNSNFLVVRNGGKLSVTGTVNANAGSSFNVNAGSEVTATGNITILGSTNINAGTLISTAGTITVGNLGNLTVSSVGGSLSSAGLLTVNAGGSMTVQVGAVSNSVGFTVASGVSAITINGEMNLGGGVWTNSSTVSALTGKVYNFSSLVNNSLIALTGVLNGPSIDGVTNNQRASSTITNNGVSANLTMQGAAVIHIKGTSNTSGLICGANTFNNDSGLSTIFTYGASLINFGTTAETFDNITVSDGSLTLTATATDANTLSTLTINNGTSATFSAGGNLNMISTSFVNNGSFTNAGNIVFLDLTLSPTSTLFTNNGTVRVTGNFNNNKGSGGFVSGPSSTVEFALGGGKNLNSSDPSYVTAFRNLTLTDPTANLVGSGSFSVAGTYSNVSTTPTVFTNNTVTFSGTGTIGSAAAATTFNNLTISGTRRSADGSSIDLTGTLTLSGAGTFDADGTANNAIFTIKSSDVTQTGSIATLPTPANLTGNMRLERAYTTGARRWQYIAFPFASSITVASLETAGFPVRGRFDSGVNGESMFLYKSGLGFEQWIGIGWSGLAKSAYTLPNNVGYAALADATNSGLIQLTGTPAKGNISIPVVAGGPTGYNLIPNPYPAPLNWLQLITTNGPTGNGRLGTLMEVEKTVAAGNVGESTTSATATYSSTGVCTNCDNGWNGTIAPWQSFWVTALTTGNVSVTEAMKATGSSLYIGRTEQSTPRDYIRISLTSGRMKDESVILFRDNATESFDLAYDGKKRLSGDPVVEGSEVRTYVNVGTLKSDTPDPLVFNFSPLVDCQTGSKRVKLYVQVTEAGSHSLKFTDLETFTLGYDISLVDKIANKTVPVKNGTVYGFSTTDLASSVSNDRFELVFAPAEIQTPVIAVQGTKLTTAAAPAIQWYKDGVAITGATKAEFTVDNTGSYTVQAGYSVACTKVSAPVVMTITGTKETRVFAAYPNPSEGVFTLSVPKLVSLDQLKVADARGIEVNASIERASNDSVIINLSNQATGFYIVKIKEGNTNHFVKLIKK
jgi:hypothetical protein